MEYFAVPAEHISDALEQFNISELQKFIEEKDERVIAITCVYAALALGGLISNIWVFRVMGTVWKRGGGRISSIVLYMLALASVDIIVLLWVPATVSDLNFGEWLLPEWMCPVYWFVEMLNKNMSSLIVAFMAVSCYFAVCRPTMRNMYRSYSVGALNMGVGLTVLIWQGVSIYENSQVFYLLAYTDNKTMVTLGRKCLFQPERIEDTNAFTAVSVITGYVLPVLAMVLSYTAILRKVSAQSRLTKTRCRLRFYKVAKISAILVVFYLVTWTPYWITTVFIGVVDSESGLHNSLGRIAFIVHLFPFANSAFSPLIYTLLNRDIRRIYGKSEVKSQCSRSTACTSV